MTADVQVGSTAGDVAWLDDRFRPAARPAFVEPLSPRSGQFRVGEEESEPVGVPAPAGLRRERLLNRCVTAHDEGSLIVTGPPGAGKTELVAQFTRQMHDSGEHVGWLSVDDSFRHPHQVVDGVADAMLGTTAPYHRQTSIRRLADEVRRLTGPCTLVIDDADLLAGAQAVMLGRVIQALPRNTRLVLAGRAERAEWSTPLRLGGAVHTIDGEGLRFRVDEVVSLFRDHYDVPLSDAAIEALTERTEGWIMAIHLFHLATSDCTPDQRVAAIAKLAGSRLLRDYLTATVLADLPANTVELLLFSSAFAPVDPKWCDALLDRSNCGWTLERLVDQNLLVRRVGDGDKAGYRYHSLLRDHLVAELRARIGPDALREHYGKIARLYESVGRDHEALVAYLRAADLRASTRMVGARRTGQPTAVRAHRRDVHAELLARARALAVNDHLSGALSAYQEAATALAGTELHADCVRERELVAVWSCGAVPPSVPSAHWLGQLRRALDKRPAALAEHPMADTGDGWSLAAGIASFLDSRPDEAVRHWRRIPPTRTDVIGLLGNAVRVVAENWTNQGAIAPALDVLATQAEADCLDAVGAVVRALSALSGAAVHIEDAERIEARGHAAGNPWVSLVASAAAAIGRCRSGVAAAEALSRCARRAANLEAGAVEAMALTIMARYIADADGIADAFDGRARRELGAAAASTVIQRPPPRPAERVTPPRLASAAVLAQTLRIRCFGQFELAAGELPLDWRGLRPRVQSVLRLLALRADRGVHVDTLYQCFWPGAPLESARRSLHVAVSMIRRMLGEVPAPGWPHSPLERRGDMYVLEIPPGSDVDIMRFGTALSQWRTARRGTDLVSVLKPLRTAYSLYTGELLPEDGTAEWVLADRARCRALMLEVACALAAIELKLGNPGNAATVCTRAIEIDRFHDPAWNLLIRAYESGNELGAAQQARNHYQEVLAELGVGAVAESQPSSVNARTPR
ncbi:BTAD domain-containing putative transcriptional regulator [Amycolatopsis sp. H20-H5]|uniref:BTAD domain-containing putative transcriptional regulator n=1 Tax=Amycolatopsis sp. H20-H5 TaxID=3046309 RepID=UPI002DB81962|nr:BTAD domain-containing putative transcriptional regulator [Amycolatopsis sp. H20-H5]MEC3981869.1 BTAD domain-containing putative transcriptional regulator [Amycolatopsis sp. H20-H5]